MTAFLRHRRHGFSLVEVVTALGIATICLLTLLGLLAVGVTSNKTTINQSIAVNIASAVAADLRATPLANQSYTGSGYALYSPRFRFQLPAAGMQTVYVSDQGTPITILNANLPANTASYRVTLQGPARPTGTGQRFASPVYILVTWPGEADPTATKWPSAYAGSFQVVSYLDQN